MPALSPRLLAILQISAVFIVGSFARTLVKKTLFIVPAYTLTYLQLAVGTAVVTFWVYGIRREPLPRAVGREIWLHILGMGIGTYTVVRVLMFLSLGLLPVTTHAYLMNFAGFLTLLFGALILKEKPTGIQLLGAFLAFTGLSIFFKHLPSPDEAQGLLYLGIAVVCLALTNLITRHITLINTGQVTTGFITVASLWIGALPIIAHGLIFDFPTATLRPEDWTVIAFSGTIGTAGMLVWNHVMRFLRAFEASLLAASTLIYTSLFAIPVLGEHLQGHQLAGIALMFLGLIGVQIRHRLRDAKRGPEAP